MPYHESLWVATAAAAPVIALAAVLSASDWFSLIRLSKGRAYATGAVVHLIVRLFNGQLLLVAGNLTIQTTMLLGAMWSLAAEQDIYAVVFPVVAEPLGVLMLLGSSMITAQLRGLTGGRAESQEADSEG